MAARTPLSNQPEPRERRRIESGIGAAIGTVTCWLAVRSSRSKRLGHLIVGASAAIAFVLAIVGLRQWDVENSAVSLSLGALIAGAIELFRVGGSPPLAIGESVPLAWDVARLLAPLATAGAVIAVFLAVGEQRLHRVAASRARGHLLLVGPADRTAGFRVAFASLLAVHASGNGHYLVNKVVRSDADPMVDGWSTVAGAEAQTIVIAAGDDNANVALCASLWPVLADRPHLEVIVEIDDHETALRFATAMAADDWTRQVEIICRSDLIVEGAVAAILDSISENRTLLIAGDRDLLDRVADSVSRRLWDLVQLSGMHRRRVALLEQRTAGLSALAARFSDPTAFEVRHFSTLSDVFAWESDPVSAVVDFNDPTETLRVALSLVSDRPGSTVCLRSSATRLPLGLVPLDQGAAGRKGRSAGIWARVASDLWPAPINDNQWSVQLEATERIREAIAVLVGTGEWNIAPSCDEDIGVSFLSSATLAASGLSTDLQVLPIALSRSGFAVLPAELTGAVGGRGSLGQRTVPMVEDNLIEQIAEQIHLNYTEHLDPLEAALPANKPWQELGDQHRAMNRLQARENVVRLAARGFAVVRAVQLGDEVVHGLAEDDVERLARDEHDRWSRQKYAQGYRYGPTRNDESIPKTHPDLVSWDDLDEATRDKDRDPIQAFISRIESIGLSVVRSSEPPSSDDRNGR